MLMNRTSRHFGGTLGADQTDAEHQATDLAVGGFKSRLMTSPRGDLARPALLRYIGLPSVDIIPNTRPNTQPVMY
jgi:hypothetical protein